MSLGGQGLVGRALLLIRCVCEGGGVMMVGVAISL
jgi:hypothetical protein